MARWPVQQPERFATDGAGGDLDPGGDRGREPGHLDPAPVPRRHVDQDQDRRQPADGVGVGDLALIPGTTTLWGTGGLLTTAGGDAAIWEHGIPGFHLAVREHRAGLRTATCGRTG